MPKTKTMEALNLVAPDIAKRYKPPDVYGCWPWHPHSWPMNETKKMKAASKKTVKNHSKPKASKKILKPVKVMKATSKKIAKKHSKPKASKKVLKAVKAMKP